MRPMSNILTIKRADMPYKPKRSCYHPRCNKLIRLGEVYCDEHQKQYEKDRGTSTQRGYGSRWRKARRLFLNENPLCALCPQPATVVDHKVPHRGNEELFWDESNWQSLCTKCHNRKTMKEKRGIA